MIAGEIDGCERQSWAKAAALLYKRDASAGWH
jgi:hypothetical protein